MHPLLQIPILIVTTALFHRGTSNPNLSSANDHVPDEGVAATLAVFVGPLIGRTLVWASTFYQAFYLFLQTASPTSISTLYPQMTSFMDPLPVSTLTALGYVLMAIGGLGRVWCYRTLGKFFTFQLSIRQSHQLIKDGPYAYVRHPSYTFAVILTTGMFLVHRRLANFFPHRVWIHVIFGPWGFLSNCMILYYFLGRRVQREEAELANKFGKEWKEYAAQTKRYVPGVM